MVGEDLVCFLALRARRNDGLLSSSCMDGPRFARRFWRLRQAVWSGHVSGLLMRSSDRWPRWVTRIGLPALRRALLRDDETEFPDPACGDEAIQ